MTVEERGKFMSDAYWARWNSDEQARIDEDIEKFRKADAKVQLGAPAGAKVKIEQKKHDFVFGAHLFNFNQLGSHEANERYKALYGHDALFNSATIAFYWRPFEPKEGEMRFEETETDTEEWWNARGDKAQWEKFWRRPPSEPCVKFAEEKGIRRHGHTLVWGNRQWHYPDWLWAKLPKEILAAALTEDRSGVGLFKQPQEKLASILPPDFPAAVASAHENRIRAIAERYGKRIHSWDVCNESAIDFKEGNLVPGLPISRGYHDTFMPGDYCHFAFQTAMKYLPPEAKLNINDYHLREVYAEQVKDMLARGDKIDIMGLQMHLFNPSQCRAIAEGSELQCPKSVRDMMKMVYVPKMPTHLSEITITSPGGDAAGEAVQATIARNLYRLWFSLEPMMGITWWNVVDGCGAPGEPSVSGLFHRDMTPKESYFALDELINSEWRTNLDLEADGSGAVSFRGFRGEYLATWTDASGAKKTQTFHVA